MSFRPERTFILFDVPVICAYGSESGVGLLKESVAGMSVFVPNAPFPPGPRPVVRFVVRPSSPTFECHWSARLGFVQCPVQVCPSASVPAWVSPCLVVQQAASFAWFCRHALSFAWFGQRLVCLPQGFFRLAGGSSYRQR